MNSDTQKGQLYGDEASDPHGSVPTSDKNPKFLPESDVKVCNGTILIIRIDFPSSISNVDYTKALIVEALGRIYPNTTVRINTVEEMFGPATVIPLDAPLDNDEIDDDP